LHRRQGGKAGYWRICGTLTKWRLNWRGDAVADKVRNRDEAVRRVVAERLSLDRSGFSTLANLRQLLRSRLATRKGFAAVTRIFHVGEECPTSPSRLGLLLRKVKRKGEDGEAQKSVDSISFFFRN
jgi:hypothetical protein